MSKHGKHFMSRSVFSVNIDKKLTQSPVQKGHTDTHMSPRSRMKLGHMGDQKTLTTDCLLAG